MCRKVGQPWAELVRFENKGRTYQMVTMEDETVGGLRLHRLCADWSDWTEEKGQNRVGGLTKAIERSQQQVV